MYLFVLGAFILIALYIEQNFMIYALCLWLLFEGITGVLLTRLSHKLIPTAEPVGLTTFRTQQRFDFEALRAARILIAAFLGGAFFLLNEYDIEVLWFFPWFMGFAILGAGVSGVCPIVLLTKWIGFK
ncbi:MAG: hypothetical protein BMS9Abin31_1164 [Gammaproteobacteria bacterium]|nr:MAG: hypothetical protein BMS9Abin31_1164 [Gammaproteobacteria bacterium]